MTKERWVLIKANKYDITDPTIFNTYYDAHKEMKTQYECFSKDCVGELNDDNAWYIDDDDNITNWKIFCVD